MRDAAEAGAEPGERDAKAGTERAPPVSAAIGFSATTAIHGAPNDTPRMTSDRRGDPIHEAFGSRCWAFIPASSAWPRPMTAARSGANPNVSWKRAA